MAENLIQNFLVGQSASMTTLKKTLDAQAMRQKAHAQNIANAETPGYRRVAVDFEDELKSVLDQGSIGDIRREDDRHMGVGGAGSLRTLQPKIRQEALDPNGSGVNGVNIDLEMAQMAETQLRYMTALELLKRRYQSLKMAIRGQ